MEAREKARALLAINPGDKAAKEMVSLQPEEPDGLIVREGYREPRVDSTVVVWEGNLFEDLELADTVSVADEDDNFIHVEERITSPAIPFDIVEQKPTFHGGDASEFWKWVNPRLEYPGSARACGIQGLVLLQFVIEADGRVTDVRVLTGAGDYLTRYDLNEFNKDRQRKDKLLFKEFRRLYDTLDTEAVRVVSDSPRWEPGRQDNRPVRVSYTFPVVFQLQ